MGTVKLPLKPQSNKIAGGRTEVKARVLQTNLTGTSISQADPEIAEARARML